MSEYSNVSNNVNDFYDADVKDDKYYEIDEDDYEMQIMMWVENSDSLVWW